MKIDVLDYYSQDEWQAFKNESAKHETPFLMVNLNIIRKKYTELTNFFPFAVCDLACVVTRQIMHLCCHNNNLCTVYIKKAARGLLLFLSL